MDENLLNKVSPRLGERKFVRNIGRVFWEGGGWEEIFHFCLFFLLFITKREIAIIIESEEKKTRTSFYNDTRLLAL